MKQILRKVLGKASVTYEEMTTILSDVDRVINSRPLTYLSDNPDDFTPLTPAMFLQEIKEIGVPDLDILQNMDLSGRNISTRKNCKKICVSGSEMNT